MIPESLHTKKTPDAEMHSGDNKKRIKDNRKMKKLIIALIAIAVVGLGYYFIRTWWEGRLLRNPSFACGNGRIEATEINIAAKQQGKVERVLVQEGDKVAKGQTLVKMETNVLEAQLEQAKAKLEQAVAAEASAQAKIAVQTAVVESAKASMEKAKAAMQNAEVNYLRYKGLWEKEACSKQHYDNAETLWITRKNEYAAAVASVREAEANLLSVKADAAGAKANILAAKAEIRTIQEQINDSTLVAPLMGRIQYRIAEPGEALSAGGRAINMVDLTDVYITFFLPEEAAGKVRLGADVRIKLDAVPGFAFPAKVTYVANVAQFTPKTVETQIERQKLMFRVKAHIPAERLLKHIDFVKTGLPGVAWVRLNDKEPWPRELFIREEVEALDASRKGSAQ